MLQQLYMIPTFREHLPRLEDPTFKEEEADDNMLFQLKASFIYLLFFQRIYFVYLLLFHYKLC